MADFLPAKLQKRVQTDYSRKEPEYDSGIAFRQEKCYSSSTSSKRKVGMYMSSVGKIRKRTDNRFLNLYELEAIHRDGRVTP